MLTINPSKRITAAEALKHPWISVSLPQQGPSQEPLLTSGSGPPWLCPWPLGPNMGSRELAHETLPGCGSQGEVRTGGVDIMTGIEWRVPGVPSTCSVDSIP